MSMYKHSKQLKLRDSLWLNFVILQIFGYWPPEKRKSLAYRIFQVMALSFIFFLYTTQEALNAIFASSDLEKISDALFLLLTHLSQIFKLHSFITKRWIALKLLDILEDDIFQPINEKQYKRAKSTINRSAWYYYIFLLMAVATCTLWGAFPFLEEAALRLPLSAWYPFDTSRSPIFEIIYTHQMVMVVINAITNISLDCVCSGFMAQICAQLDILNDTIENIREYATLKLEENYENSKKLGDNNLIPFNPTLMTEELQKEMDGLFVRCLKHHWLILEFSEMTETAFGYNAFFQFFFSAILICLTMFELTLVSVFSLRFFSMVLYQGCMLMEIIMYCYYGNEIILKSNFISQAAYNSDWADCNDSYKKNILFMMTRGKKITKISAGNFFTLSLETFGAIIRSSWSYFAVLRQAHNK